MQTTEEEEPKRRNQKEGTKKKEPKVYIAKNVHGTDECCQSPRTGFMNIKEIICVK